MTHKHRIFLQLQLNVNKCYQRYYHKHHICICQRKKHKRKHNVSKILSCVKVLVNSLLHRLIMFLKFCSNLLSQKRLMQNISNLFMHQYMLLMSLYLNHTIPILVHFCFTLQDAFETCFQCNEDGYNRDFQFSVHVFVLICYYDSHTRFFIFV